MTILILLFVLLIFLVLPNAFVESTGKGPVGSYAINDRYVLVSDSNFDTLFIVDVKQGGGIVGTIPLHSPSFDVPNAQDGEGGDRHIKITKNWVDPTGIATCDTCNYIYFTSQKAPNFGYIQLARPLLDMAKEDNFDELSDFSARGEPQLKSLWSHKIESSMIELVHQSEGGDDDQKVFKPSKLRMIEIHRDGRRGYLSHYDLGVFTFTLSMDDGGGRFHNVVDFLPLHTLGASSISGLTLSPDEKSLIITAKRTAYIVVVSDTNSDPTITTTIHLEDICGIKFKNGRSLDMNFRDAVFSNDDIYAVGKPYGQSGTKDVGFGACLFRISRSSDENGCGYKCEAVANELGNGRGWRDGTGEDVRFTRPHSMVLLPRPSNVKARTDTDDADDDILILTDIDNRAIRRVDVHIIESPEASLSVSTVPYDENMWWKLYERSSDDITKKKGQGKGLYAVAAKNVNSNSLDSKGSTKMTYSDAADACTSLSTKQVSRRLCSLEELRKNISIVAPVQAWTLDKCHGCWLHFPGFCREGEGWDAEHHMFAYIHSASGGIDESINVRVTCTHQDQLMRAELICCEHRQEEEAESEI